MLGFVIFFFLSCSRKMKLPAFRNFKEEKLYYKHKSREVSGNYFLLHGIFFNLSSISEAFLEANFNISS